MAWQATSGEFRLGGDTLTSENDERRALAAFYKPVDGGYLYRAPSGWRIWRQPHFIVDANLRERLIAASAEPSWVVALWLAVPWVVVSSAGVFVLASYFGGSPGHTLEVFAGGLVSAIVGLVAGLAALAEHKWRRVAPLLRGAQPSAQRISARELNAAVRAAGGPSRRALFGQIVCGALLLAAGAFLGGMSIEGLNHPGRVVWPQLLSGGVMTVAGFLALYFAARKLASKTD